MLVNKDYTFLGKIERNKNVDFGLVIINYKQKNTHNFAIYIYILYIKIYSYFITLKSISTDVI